MSDAIGEAAIVYIQLETTYAFNSLKKLKKLVVVRFS